MLERFVDAKGQHMATHQAGQLQGKVAVITGAGRGIGKAIAIAYAKEGAAVCCAARSQAQIDETAAEIRHAGGQSVAIQTDVTQSPVVCTAHDLRSPPCHERTIEGWLGDAIQASGVLHDQPALMARRRKSDQAPV
jgi:NAD(P)-dependent dehydrogenase (short-subunit alcohol dehydrogenase family)